MSRVLVGTSSFSSTSWVGEFYPPGTQARDYLAYYATRFPTVEVDATFYGTPRRGTVSAWEAKTPDGFVLAAKAPQTITHEKFLVDCEPELREFLDTMALLGDKLGPLLLQFPYYARDKNVSLVDFLARLTPFLATLPSGFRYAVEVRNKTFLKPPLLDALRERNVALALIEHPYMPTAREYAAIPGLLTADFSYVRFLGNRYAIEGAMKKRNAAAGRAGPLEWTELVFDREAVLREWVERLGELTSSLPRSRYYFNNHFAGCGFKSAAQFSRLWAERMGQALLDWE